MNPQQPLGVKEFIEAVDLHLQFGYQGVTVEGEISGFRATPATFQFSLKEGEAALRSVIFKNRLQQPLEDGMKIRATGTPKLHPQYGFSFHVDSVELAGEGELMRAYELLKAKLESEGLFDVSRKRPLPRFPQRVGVITSKQGVVFHDFMKELNARWGGVHIVFVPVMVQGTGSVEQIVEAIRTLNQLPEPLEVIALIRGGGSLEDLLTFNSEPVAREVSSSRTPMVVGVGHEPDISLADLVADVRASTPTQAARIIAPLRSEVMLELNHAKQKINHHMSRQLNLQNQRLEQLARALEVVLRRPLERLRLSEMKLRQAITRMSGEVGRQKAQLAGLSRLLEAANPKKLLERGYSITSTGGLILKDPGKVKPGDALVIQLHAGKLGAKVDERKE